MTETNELTSTEQMQVANDAETANTNAIVQLATDKRPSDENDEPRASKRLRSSCLHSNTLSPTMIHPIQWTPPSKQSLLLMQSQSLSLFQFALSLVQTIVTSSEHYLTDEHHQWLIATIKQYDGSCNDDRLEFIIQIACMVTKTSLVR